MGASKRKDKFSNNISYKPLSKYEGLYGNFPVRAGTTYVGVEIELEQVGVSSTIPTSFRMTNDGSLKLDGKEFVTIPIKFCYLEQELNRLYGSLTSWSISSRCSTHVHLNARDFSAIELYNFILLYMIFEKALFRLSGNRWTNIFCVPLYSYPKEVEEVLFKLKNNDYSHWYWNKYFALNIAPLWGNDDQGVKKMGTVEFRHMQGCAETKTILNWINFIVSLKIAAKRISSDDLLSHIATMNTTSAYAWITELVFKGDSEQIMRQPTFISDMESCITCLKGIVFDPTLDKILITKNKGELNCVV